MNFLNLNNIIGNFTLSYKVRKFLTKKYPYFLHKKSTFLLLPENSKFNLPNNYIFFTDYTEFFLKYLSKKITFGSLSLRIGMSDRFSFEEDLDIDYTQSEKLKTILAKLPTTYYKDGVLLKNRLDALKKQSIKYLLTFDEKELDHYGILNILKNAYKVTKLGLDFYSNLKKNIRYLYPNTNSDQILKILTVYIDKDDIFYINDYLKKYNQVFDEEFDTPRPYSIFSNLKKN